MATLIVSFDIQWDDDSAEYNRIWKALNEAIRDGLAAHQWWGETTSFYVVNSTEDARPFAVRVWGTAKMRKAKDRLVVLDANVKAGVAIGKIQDQTIFSLLPFLANVP